MELMLDRMQTHRKPVNAGVLKYDQGLYNGLLVIWIQSHQKSSEAWGSMTPSLSAFWKAVAKLFRRISIIRSLSSSDMDFDARAIILIS
ncbi:MAG: hypothetical protein WDA14_09000, partial [Sphaerochaetaceae bacterium]